MTVSILHNLPKISVIIIVRNGAATIGRALDSLKRQYYPNLEAIVWNGMSTDDTLQVVEQYRDSIAMLVSEADSGPPDAYNRATYLATGDFIGYLNADDEYEPGMLWAVADAILKNPDADIITTGILYRKVGKQGQRTVTGYYAAEEQLALTLENILSELPSFMLSRFIKRSFRPNVGNYITDRSLCYISNDREWMTRLLFLPCRNVVVPRALYGFEQHSQNISTDPHVFIRIIDEHLLIADRLLERPDLTLAQRSTIAHWQKSQYAYGFWKSVAQGNGAKAVFYLKKGVALEGWSFIPFKITLLAQRLIKKLGLSLSGGIDRG